MMRASIAVLIMFATSPVLAQSSPQANPPAPPGSLSDKLDKTDGVIKPPADVDPKMSRPTPAVNPSSMPVIPPPGSPGGRQDVEPK